MININKGPTREPMERISASRLVNFWASVTLVVPPQVAWSWCGSLADISSWSIVFCFILRTRENKSCMRNSSSKSLRLVGKK